MEKVTKFFNEADHDESGTLSWDEFLEHLQKSEVKAYFQALDLDVSHAQSLFEMLDTDDSGSVSIDEFVEGCVRMRGGARSIDVNLVLMQCRKLTDKINHLYRKSKQQFEVVKVIERATRY